MSAKSKTRCIGIVTSGGDCPGLNAAIRGVAKASIEYYGMKVVGIQDGFPGLVQNRVIPLDSLAVSGILTRGGTILGTSRDKPNKMLVGGQIMDMTAAAVEHAHRMQIDCLVCLGGGGTMKNAMHLHREGGLNVLTLPKTIDNDVFGTDMTFGFDTAMTVATEAIDRLHSTATSHHRIIVCEIMGHNAGWLPLGAGIAGGADVILIPEIPYDLDIVAAHLASRRHSGKRFSIIAVAEGAISREEAILNAQIAERGQERKKEKGKNKEKGKDKDRDKNGNKDKGKNRDSEKAGKPGKNGKSSKDDQYSIADRDNSDAEEKAAVSGIHLVQESKASRIARELQRLTGVEARVTSLGHVVRGGSPSATDRLLCTRLGAKAAELLAQGIYNVMVAVKGDECVPVDIEQIAGRRKSVPVDHSWIQTARLVGTCLGD
ncbi:MAG: 6-phosphofructokinase [Candidatus Riflebacteria bacterium]|nr:6-phosphofructokinase [Candidatus Riflebacteria bacterium]